MKSSVSCIRILFLSANPHNASRLNFDKEVREITQKIQGSKYRNSIQIVSVWATRADDILQALNEHRPNIVHFSGHGSPNGEIMLLDEQDNAKPVPKESLEFLFQTLKDNIRVVFLNACYSKKQAEVIISSVDTVIAMNNAVIDTMAIIFAASFYRAIGFRRSVKEAFDQAIASILLEGYLADKDTPVLLTKSGLEASSIFLIQDSPIEDTSNSNLQLLDAHLDKNDSPYSEYLENGRKTIRYDLKER